MGLHKLSRAPHGFKTGQDCNTDKKVMPFQRLSNYKCVMLVKWM